MKSFHVLMAALVLSACGADARPPGQANLALYACEGCEAVYEAAHGSLSATADVAPATEPGERLLLTGTVYQVDGMTPTPGVVIYMHQTNASGRYPAGDDRSVWSRRHGRLRGWVRTGADGRYRFNTIKPGLYPGHTEPAHIHMTVLEPGHPPYWIDDVVFEGEQRVTREYLTTRQNQGGSGVVRLVRGADGTWQAYRDIVLEPHPGSR